MQHPFTRTTKPQRSTKETTNHPIKISQSQLFVFEPCPRAFNSIQSCQLIQGILSSASSEARISYFRHVHPQLRTSLQSVFVQKRNENGSNVEHRHRRIHSLLVTILHILSPHSFHQHKRDQQIDHVVFNMAGLDKLRH